MLYPYLIKTEKKFINTTALFWLIVVFVVAPISIGNWFLTGVQSANALAASKSYEATKQYVMDDMKIKQAAISTSMYQTAFPSTPLPTMELLPSITPTLPFVEEVYMFKLSFYDPAIGKYFPDNPTIGHMNCSQWNESSLTCESNMSDGTPFYDEYGKAIACPPPLQNGDILRVVYPEQLAGDWTCRDRGWAIENGVVDFLLRYPDMIWTGNNLNNFPWWSTVQAYHLHP